MISTAPYQNFEALPEGGLQSFTCDLVHVQDEPGQVADHEDGDDQHEDD